ncbi:hypothetical protein L917_17700, partial [Phytophthora nicotianae]
MSPDDCQNPRFACREHSPGSEDEAKARSFRSVSGSSMGGHTLVGVLTQRVSGIRIPELVSSHTAASVITPFGYGG